MPVTKMTAKMRPMTVLVLSALFSTAALISSSVYAQSTLPPGGNMTCTMCAQPNGTVVLLRASAEMAVDNDQVEVMLFAQEQSPDADKAANTVNQKMTQAIAQIKQIDPSAQIENTGYQTYPQYGPNTNAINGWQVRHDIKVTTKDFAKARQFVAKLQSSAGGLKMGGMQMSLSPARVAQTEQKLQELAFADLRIKIANVAKALGKAEKDVLIDEIDLQSAERPSPKMAMMAMRGGVADMAAPAMEPGQGRQMLAFTAKVRVPR